MADYVKVFETSDYDKANEYIKNGWTLINTPKKSTFNGEDGYSSYTEYTLGLSAKEHANRLLAIIREYEKYGLKEALLEKVSAEMDDNIEEYDTTGFWNSDSPLAKYMSSYEDIVNDKKVKYFKKRNNDDTPF